MRHTYDNPGDLEVRIFAEICLSHSYLEPNSNSWICWWVCIFPLGNPLLGESLYIGHMWLVLWGLQQLQATIGKYPSSEFRWLNIFIVFCSTTYIYIYIYVYIYICIYKTYVWNGLKTTSQMTFSVPGRPLKKSRVLAFWQAMWALVLAAAARPGTWLRLAMLRQRMAEDFQNKSWTFQYLKDPQK